MAATVLSAVVLAVAATAVAGSGPHSRVAQAEPTRAAAALSEFEVSVLAALNGVRRAYGLAPLRPSPQLTAAADAHSRAMGRIGFFAHESRDGSPFSDRVRRYYEPRTPRWAVGENLLWALRGTAADRMVALWMQSPTHRQNILMPLWREIGLGAVAVPAAPGFYRGLDVVIVTSDFGVR